MFTQFVPKSGGHGCIVSRNSFLSVIKCGAKIAAAWAVAGGLYLSARAQIGTGWTPASETPYALDTSAGCSSFALPAGSGVGGVFNVPNGATGRAEYRFQNLSASGTEQFQGDATVASWGGTHVTIKQTFGPAPSTPWSLIAVRTVSNGLQIFEDETGGGTLFNHYAAGQTIRINTIYNPNGGGSKAGTVDVYINGAFGEHWINGTPIEFNKIGAYINSSGHGPATITWQNVQFWVGGSLNSGTPIVVDPPSFNPVAGTYGNAQSVTITTTTSGATIRYTTDGSTATESNGTIYSSPVAISAGVTLKAIAYESGQTDSPVSSAVYAIGSFPPAAAPTFSPPAGSYTTALLSVTISSATSGASIAYTTDGSMPTETGGTTVTHGILCSNGGSITLNASCILTAIAYGYGIGASDSPATSGSYIVGTSVAAPVFSPAGGTYTSAQSVSIGTATSGASIAYTTDGSAPTESSGTITNGTLYSGAVNIGTSTPLSAIAFKSGSSDSSVTSEVYTINIPPPAATPTFSPPAGTYTSAQMVSISTATAGASINYTVDGSQPTETHGTLYAAPVAIGSTTTLDAIAFESGFSDSAVAGGVYTINLPPPIPTVPRIQGSDGKR
jgi:hypothetical protein